MLFCFAALLPAIRRPQKGLLMVCALLFGTWMGAVPAAADPVFLAPATEPSDSGAPRDGSVDAPFTSLAEALTALAADKGNRILLKAGEYGNVHWKNLQPGGLVQIESETPGAAHFDSLELSNVHNLHMTGFSVWPRNLDRKQKTLVKANKHSSRLRFEGFDLRGRADARETYMTWSQQDWKSTWRANGFRLEGPQMQVIRSRVTGIAFGITTLNTQALVAGNIVEGFSGDGLRGLGDHSRFTGNVVANCFDVDNNHDDSFQSWAPRNKGADSTVRDITVEDNLFWEWTSANAHPLRCRLQGVGLFDGFYQDFKIRNNLIVVNSYHGISIYGGIDSVIANNTVVHPDGQPGEFPWINVHAHRNGTESQNVQVYNNVAMAFRNVPNATRRNVVARFPAKLFVDPTKGDFRPHPDGPLFGTKLGSTLVEKLKF